MTNAQNLSGKTISIGSFTVNVKEKIGEGGYAIVYRCTSEQGQEYALKNVKCITNEQFDQFKQECIILHSIPSHKHIIKLFAADINSSNLTINFLFEYCPITAIGIMSHRLLTHEEIAIFFHAIADATDYLHQQNPPIIHRDLKPENLLVGLDGYPKLCDFGSSTQKIYEITDPLNCNSIKDDIERNTTQNYRAPEMIDFFSNPTLGPKTDIWALGCTLYKLIHRTDLFSPNENLAILQGRINLPPDEDPDFERAIRSCIQIDPNSRPSAKSLSEQFLQLLGDNDKISILRTNSSSTTSQIRVDEMHWYNYVKEQYRLWVASGVYKWAIKVTFPSSEPPKTKYVRRIIVASIKQAETSSSSLISYLINNRPWNKDSRIAAKLNYMILLLSQYETNLSKIISLSAQMQQILDFYIQHPPIKREWGDITVFLGKILKEKLKFHRENTEFEGNLVFGSIQLSANSKLEVKNYTKTIVNILSQLIQIVTSNDNFAFNILAQPAVEEVANAYSLLKNIDSSAIEELSAAGRILNQCKHIVYLESSVEYPIDQTKQFTQTDVNFNHVI